MRQHAFEALHQAFWQQFELDLGKLEQKRHLSTQSIAEFGHITALCVITWPWPTAAIIQQVCVAACKPW